MFPYNYNSVEVRYENYYKEKILFNNDCSICDCYRNHVGS